MFEKWIFFYFNFILANEKLLNIHKIIIFIILY